MTTTIQVTEETVDVLKKAVKPKRSMWGAGGKLGMKDILRDLRDKSDRY